MKKIIAAVMLCIGCLAGAASSVPFDECSVSKEPCSAAPYWVAYPDGGEARGCSEGTPACPLGWVCGTENDAGELVVGVCR